MLMFTAKLILVVSLSATLGLSMGFAAVRWKLAVPATIRATNQVADRKPVVPTARQLMDLAITSKGKGVIVKAGLLIYDTRAPYIVVNRIEVHDLRGDEDSRDVPIWSFEFDPLICAPMEIVSWLDTKEVPLEPGTYVVGVTVNKNGSDVSARSDIVTIVAE